MKGSMLATVTLDLITTCGSNNSLHWPVRFVKSYAIILFAVISQCGFIYMAKINKKNFHCL